MTAEELKRELAAEVAGDDDVVGRLAERVGASAQASAVFGEAVEREGVTVIPVAKARWGFGGGSGSNDEGGGAGGGGGGLVSPLGYIEVRGDEARFRPIRDPRLIALTVVGVAGIVGAAGLAFAGRLGRDG